jgi:hypothetical protein
MIFSHRSDEAPDLPNQRIKTMAGYREPAGKYIEPQEKRLWHVMYLIPASSSVPSSIRLQSFFDQEEMNTWLETNRSTIDASKGFCYTVNGHMAKVKIQTIHTIHTEPLT